MRVYAPAASATGIFSRNPATLAKVWDEANRGASTTFPAGVDYTVPANRRAQLYAYAEAHPSIAFDAGQTGEIDLQVTPAGGALATTVLLRWNGAGLDAETRLGQGVPLDLGPGERGVGRPGGGSLGAGGARGRRRHARERAAVDAEHVTSLKHEKGAPAAPCAQGQSMHRLQLARFGAGRPGEQRIERSGHDSGRFVERGFDGVGPGLGGVGHGGAGSPQPISIGSRPSAPRAPRTTFSSRPSAALSLASQWALSAWPRS